VKVTYLKPVRSVRQAGAPRAVTWGHFRWLGWVAVGAAVFALAPRPALKWQYEFSSARGFDPYAERFYHRCDYISPVGSFTVRPADGKCEWVKWVWRKPS
jgi:hypothetical protein